MAATSDATATITKYTDPMCTWCWGSEPMIRHLRVAFGDQIQLEYVMGGLIEDFDQFYDAANDIAEPSEVAPHWAEASQRHGMPVDTDVWEVDPALSTYPASKTYVAARQQDRELAHRYLRLLRETYATQQRNTNRRAVQVDLAERVGLDVDAFTTALDDGSADREFEHDLTRTRSADVRAFPTYDLEGPAGQRRLSGFKGFDELAAGLREVAPSVEASSPPHVSEFVDDYGPVATQEVAEVYDLTPSDARQRLQALVEQGLVRHEQRGNGSFWTTVEDASVPDGDAT